MRALFDVVAPAKLNVFLHVIGRRADGYHLLQSLFVLIDWCDRLHFEVRNDGRLARHDLGTPLPEDDLCLRAARRLQAASQTRLGVDISIDKQVPSGAGMGGGSSDAASTLLALNRLWRLGWSQAQLLSLALELGADVPFFVGGRNALVEGIGEQLTPIEVAPQWFAVVKPPAHLETKAIFQSPLLSRSSATATIAGFSGGAFAASFGRNDLQAAAEAACPDVKAAATLLQAHLGNSRMTGSGSAVFAHAGSGVLAAPGMPAVLPAGWQGRMCRSMTVHPLAEWAD